MVREVITVCVGQAGIQLGQNVWERYCVEHKINKLGIKKTTKFSDNSFRSFYEETDAGQYVPRNLMVDLEPNVIDDIKSSKYSKIYDTQFLLAGKEDAANNFARGHFTVGKEIIDDVNDRIRKQFDSCDNLQGFIMNHSLGGGTGSGLGSLILERLAVDYRKKMKFGFEIYPSPQISTSVVEVYNALLATHWLLDYTQVSVVLDNEALYEICQKKLNIGTPSYNDINKLITRPISSITSKLRFEGELNVDLNEFQTNLVPFPRLHFIFTSTAPIINQWDYNKNNENISTQSMTESCFNSDNFFVKIPDFDAEEDKYMAISVNFSGDVNAKQANATVQWLKTNKKVTFVEWCPTGFKVGLDDDTIGLAVGGARDINNFRKIFEESQSQPKKEKKEHIDSNFTQNAEIAAMKKGVVMMGNNVFISRVFSGRISRQFDLMYSQRAFVHWYVQEGMEEGEFAEAREDLGFLEKDYLDVVSEQATDEEYDSDSEYEYNYNNNKCNKQPQLDAITYNGILYEYYFDTKTRKSKPITTYTTEGIDEKKNDNIDDNDDKKMDNCKLFYPTYCYAKIKATNFDENETENGHIHMNDSYEYYMTIGLNSNIKQSEFKRKHQNLVIVLDISGSMGYPFGYTGYGCHSNEKTKMEIANEAVITLIKKLQSNDRFGLIIFDDAAKTIQKLQLICDINLNELYKQILSFEDCGGTNFEAGYCRAISLYSELNKYAFCDEEYFNRIIVLTDAQPNIGTTDPNSMLNLVKYYGNSKENKFQNYIYTTFIGIGLDFNSNLIEYISSVRGANYYVVKSAKDFIIRMDEEFEYMVTPLVFNVCLKLNVEGNSCKIDKVYGGNEKKMDQILKTGQIMSINTLFPSKKSKKKGGIKGGIQLIKLKQCGDNNDKINVEIVVSFEDVNGKKYENKQFVTFDPPKLYPMNDMIDNDVDENEYEKENFYDNLGIRKGILLCKYVSLMRNWIQSTNKFKYQSIIFPKFLKYFNYEMKKCKDNQLEKEVTIIKKIINGN